MRVQLYSWAPVFFVEHLDVQLRHLPAETKAKSVVSAVATGLRQEAELGDAGIQIEKATLGRNKQHPIEEALRSSEHERDADEARVITSPALALALALERCDRMSQHLPAATETKSLVSPPATSLRQEAELGDGMTAEEHRPALQRQAEEHHRPEQASDRGSASSGPQDAPVTAQLCVLHAGLIDKIDPYSGSGFIERRGDKPPELTLQN